MWWPMPIIPKCRKLKQKITSSSLAWTSLSKDQKGKRKQVQSVGLGGTEQGLGARASVWMNLVPGLLGRSQRKANGEQCGSSHIVCRRMSEAPVPTCTAVSKASFMWQGRELWAADQIHQGRIRGSESFGWRGHWRRWELWGKVMPVHASSCQFMPVHVGYET